MSDRFSVTYRVTVNDGRTIDELAADIAIEQTVETPADCIPRSIVDAGIVGRVESIIAVPASPDRHDVVISFRCDQTGFCVPQFLNVIYGNISIKNNVKIVALHLPESLQRALGGPQFGIEGIRTLTGVRGRPLSCTALKPMGLPAAELAAKAAAYARGGIDLIKEDHGMADVPYHPFEERVARCQEAVTRANAAAGTAALYFPMVSGGFDRIEEQFYYVNSLGIRGVLAAPMLTGPDTVRALARRYGLAVMGHPAFTGTHFSSADHGMTPAVLLGTIFRLIGADISIFPNAGGRFSFSEAECLDLAAALRTPLTGVRPALPCPAGGMGLDRIGSMVRMFGPDTVLLIGGALMQHSNDLERSSRVFVDRIREPV